MKYVIECLVDEYVSCSADLYASKGAKLKTLLFLKKGQKAILSADEYKPYARGFNGLIQIKKVMVTAENELLAPKAPPAQKDEKKDEKPAPQPEAEKPVEKPAEKPIEPKKPAPVKKQESPKD